MRVEKPMVCPRCQAEPKYDPHGFPFPVIECCGVIVQGRSRALCVKVWNDYADNELQRMAFVEMAND